MDKLAKYTDYTSDDFVEDSSFWNWVLEEDKGNDFVWHEFMRRNPGHVEVMKKAREKVLSLNAERHLLADKRITSLWAKIQQSKNKETVLDSTNLYSGLSGPSSLNPPSGQQLF